MGIPLLILCLEGPLQSWGVRSRWIYRETESMPTKSGIIGLLSCAMGLPRNDPKIVQLDKELIMGIRADKVGSDCVDYHTVSGTIHTADDNERGKKDQGSTIVTYRNYLHDAVFTIVLEGKRELLEECEKALNNPRWVISLGRKSCVPTRPVLEKITEDYPSVRKLLEEYPIFVQGANSSETPKNSNKTYLCEIEKENGLHERQDRYQNNPARMYCYRNVERFLIPSPQVQSSEVTR